VRNRSRVVTFRLSQEEYAALDRACSGSGRSVSDFLRFEILGRLQCDRLAALEQRIRDLQSAVARLERKP